MPSWTPQSISATTWDSANVAGVPWQYDEADIAYDSVVVQYEQFEEEQSYTNATVASASFTNQTVN